MQKIQKDMMLRRKKMQFNFSSNKQINSLPVADDVTASLSDLCLYIAGDATLRLLE